MTIQIDRNELHTALHALINVVERRQTMPILANFLLEPAAEGIRVTASDIDIQLVAFIHGQLEVPSSVAVPARKLYDICRGLPDNSTIKGHLDQQRLTLHCGRSRFTLSTAPGEAFPQVTDIGDTLNILTEKQPLAKLISKTQFAMANQDVRYYLNGLLLAIQPDVIRAVATDGHRLALCDIENSHETAQPREIIVPRKAVGELQRLLERTEGTINLEIGTNHLRAQFDNITFTSKLIDGRYPDYNRVIPERGDKVFKGDRQTTRESLMRAAILSNEKFRGVRVQFSEERLSVQAQNPDNEVAEEEIEGDYTGTPIEIGFNVNYLIEALSVLDGQTFTFTLTTPDDSGLLLDDNDPSCLYVVMPMRL